MAPPYRVVIIHEHPIVRQGLRALLAQRPTMNVLGDTACADAVAYARALGPHVILLDLSSDAADDHLPLLAQLRASLPEARIIILAEDDDDPTLVVRAMRAGASGCVLQPSGGLDELVTAIHAVAWGQLFLAPPTRTSRDRAVDPARTPRSAEPVRAGAHLTAREDAVLNLVAHGATNRQVAAHLGISEHTVRHHLSSVLEKLELTTRLQAAVFALRTRVIGPRAERAPAIA